MKLDSPALSALSTLYPGSLADLSRAMYLPPTGTAQLAAVAADTELVPAAPSGYVRIVQRIHGHATTIAGATEGLQAYTVNTDDAAITLEEWHFNISETLPAVPADVSARFLNGDVTGPLVLVGGDRRSVRVSATVAGVFTAAWRDVKVVDL